VLLPGGHLLVAKEKKPAALIEFGPPDSRSRGLLRGGALADGERWPTKKGRHWFVALANWIPDKTLAKTSICSVTSPPQLRGSMIFRQVAAPRRSLMRGGSAIWMASRKGLHSPHRVTQSSGSTHAAAPKSRPARAGGC
jgi:hypothetical protein